MFDNEEFELSNDLEIDTLLAELPIELLKESIKEQIEDPLQTNVDFINVVIEKCELLKKEFENDPDNILLINRRVEPFFEFIIQQINERFDLGLDMDSITTGEYVELAEILYNFFILRYKKNISKFIYKYILKNKKFLSENFENLNKKKDVSQITLKKTLKNKDEINILSNLHNIIRYILSLEFDPQDFLKYCCREELYEGIKIKGLILEGKMLGNFVSLYLLPIQDKYDNIVDEIQTEVKYKILKKIQE